MSNATTRQTYEQLEAIISAQQHQLASQQHQLTSQQAQIAALTLQAFKLEALNKQQACEIVELKKRIFGKSSEKKSKGKNPEKKSGHVNKRKKPDINDDSEDKKLPKGSFPKDLPREQLSRTNIPAGEKIEDYYFVSEEVTEQLRIHPAKLYVLETTTKIYKRKSDGFFPPAPKKDHPLGRCSFDLSFICYVLVQKILFHIPFYRTEKIFELEGLKCHRSNFVRWATRSADLLKPIVAAILRAVKKSEVVYGDESPITVNCLHNTQSKTYRNTYFWNLLAPEVGIVFRWTSTRNGEHAKEFLKEIKTFVSDALNIYQGATKHHDIPWQICWVHVRRNFHKVQDNLKLANQAIERIDRMLKLDKQIRKRFTVPEKFHYRTRYRKRFLEPLVNEMRSWCESQQSLPAVQADVSMTKAINYLLTKWNEATLFITNPYVIPHNNMAEQYFRYLKLGEKNWMFCGSELGAETLCILYTLIYSAKMLAINPMYYLMDILKLIDHKGYKADDLIPSKWKESREKIVTEENRNSFRS